MEQDFLKQIIGDNVYKYRNVASLTQQQLAEQVEVSAAFISRVERGQKMMKVHTLYTVANALNVSCDALLRKESQLAQLENIMKLLADLPVDCLISVEKIVRVFLEESYQRDKRLLEVR